MSGAVDSGEEIHHEEHEAHEGEKKDAETALHYLRACLNKYPPYTEPLEDGRPRMMRRERLTAEEKSAQLQAMQELLDWLAA